MGTTPLQRYRQELQRDGFRADPAQARAVESLDALYIELLPEPVEPSWWQRLRGARPNPVCGLYLWGDTGRGKTWLMDTFHDALPFAGKERMHFHRFMQFIHERLRGLPKTPDPLPVLAAQLARQFRVLCLDEFHVHDIADAMLMAGLLRALFDQGITLVATSNVAPPDLYKNGLQREKFLYAIDLIEHHTRTVELNGDTDFRLQVLEQNDNYRVGAVGEHDAAMRSLFERMAPARIEHDVPVPVKHQRIPARALADDVVWFEFSALCDAALWAGDYLELARTFHTLFLTDIPRLDEGRDDAAKRFIHLVDALYDHNVKLLASAADEPAALYSGRALAFAFQRTSSRLAEMRSHRYHARAHRP